MKTEVLFYHKLEKDKAKCGVCPHNCQINPGKKGVCRVRINLEGTLFATNYGEISSIALDPIEKKPLYHFHPGSMILSVGTVGCNFSCGFCQNYQIAHEDQPTRYLSPKGLLAMARECEPRGSIGVAYTYSEPLMWHEYLSDVLPIIKAEGLKNVLVTNAYVNPEPLQKILPDIDGINIDLKSFSDKYYRTHCHGRLTPVKNTIELCATQTHVELTTLLVTGLNDTPKELEELFRWVAKIDPTIPLHLSAYHPAYKFSLPATPYETMKMAREIARTYLKNVYVGNMSGFDNDSYCPHCQALLVSRKGYRVMVQDLNETRCDRCGNQVSFVI